MARQRRNAAAEPPRPEPTGTVSRSQAVSTFGPGSIYELRRYSAGAQSLHSVMIAGLEDWDAASLAWIYEPVLARALNVRGFKLPPSKADFDRRERCHVPAYRFPKWLVCERCYRLGQVSTGVFEDLGNYGPKCRAAGCGGRGIPSRLVVACYPNAGEEDNQPGHIDDFPWVSWLFPERETRCLTPQLKLQTTGTTAGLAGLEVSCHCGRCKGNVRRSLEGVFSSRALSHCHCFGSRPWLQDRDPNGCERPIRALLRGASNVYFPVTASAISIPPYSQSVYQLLQDQGAIILSNVGTVQMSILIQMARNAIPELARTREDGNEPLYSDAEIDAALQTLAGTGNVPAVQSEREQRTRERGAILVGREADAQGRSEFEAAVHAQASLPHPLGAFFSHVVLVHRIREVRALRGFCRVNPPLGGDAYNTPCASISQQPQNWLPAIEVRGEGIYFELDPVRVRVWENRDDVKARLQTLRANLLTAWRRRFRDDPPEEAYPTARYILIHTLSHLLIKQLSLECGYSSASLRERLYVRDDNPGPGELGILIYTATTGADGTNGGLVRQGQPNRFGDIFLAALEGAGWCSSDPLCAECRGQGSDALNLAACHACCLVSETSCEHHNTFLDRGMVVGLPGRPELGYFHELINPGSGGNG